MNRRSFLSTLALLPGLGWLKSEPLKPSAEEIAQMFALTNDHLRQFAAALCDLGQQTAATNAQLRIAIERFADAKPENG